MKEGGGVPPPAALVSSCDYRRSLRVGQKTPTTSRRDATLPALPDGGRLALVTERVSRLHREEEAMNRLWTALFLPAFVVPLAQAAEPAKVPLDTYAGYFVSNRFEPHAAEPDLVIAEQRQGLMGKGGHHGFSEIVRGLWVPRSGKPTASWAAMHAQEKGRVVLRTCPPPPGEGSRCRTGSPQVCGSCLSPEAIGGLACRRERTRCKSFTERVFWMDASVGGCRAPTGRESP